MVQREQYDKKWGSKKPFLEVAVAAPARVIVVSSSPLRRVALRDAMRALSCVPHAIAATFEDTAADLAQERRGADDATMAAASVESCRFVARRSLGRRLGSVLHVGNRLHRMRRGFHR